MYERCGLGYDTMGASRPDASMESTVIVSPSATRTTRPTISSAKRENESSKSNACSLNTICLLSFEADATERVPPVAASCAATKETIGGRKFETTKNACLVYLPQPEALQSPCTKEKTRARETV